jgi:hypothetical protein
MAIKMAAIYSFVPIFVRKLSTVLWCSRPHGVSHSFSLKIDENRTQNKSTEGDTTIALV